MWFSRVSVRGGLRLVRVYGSGWGNECIACFPSGCAGRGGWTERERGIGMESF